jgi:hypothetical protein
MRAVLAVIGVFRLKNNIGVRYFACLNQEYPDCEFCLIEYDNSNIV